jgi:ATP-dependent protease ClpP protease subunit
MEEASIHFFKNLHDSDFYSDKINHLYISGDIDSSKIDKLIEDIRNINIEPNPKPILIHISSMGGILQDGLKLLTIFKISNVPIATIVDNYCFSIATLLLINSPYRIMNKYSYCLLHEYRITGYLNDGRQKILNYINKIDSYFKNIINLYLKKTLFKKEELHDLLEHNLLLDSIYCLKKGIVDRIIDYNSINKENTKINILKLLNSSTNINNLIISCNMKNEEINNNINKINTKYPTIIYTTFNNCTDTENKDDDDKNNMYMIFNSFNLIPKIKRISSYKYGIIDVPISIENLLPILHCNKIIMYSHCYIICNLLYSFYNYSILLDDNIKNTKLILKKIKEILKTKSKMTNEYINNIDKKFMIIDANKAKELGLCHEIIYI